jgi:hypothetical protein
VESLLTVCIFSRVLNQLTSVVYNVGRRLWEVAPSFGVFLRLLWCACILLKAL